MYGNSFESGGSVPSTLCDCFAVYQAALSRRGYRPMSSSLKKDIALSLIHYCKERGMSYDTGDVEAMCNEFPGNAGSFGEFKSAAIRKAGFTSRKRKVNRDEQPCSGRKPFHDINGVFDTYITSIYFENMNPSRYEEMARGLIGCARSYGIRSGLKEPLYTKDNDALANSIIELWKREYAGGKSCQIECMPFLKVLVEGVS